MAVNRLPMERFSIATEYMMSHLGVAPPLRPHVIMKYYDAGHMMYLRDEDLTRLKNNISAFVDIAAK
jgi:carboxypeptidase C (cathepsin A)